MSKKSTRTVTRVYFSKKTGLLVTKLYVYSTKPKGKKSLLVLGKGGREYKDRINDLLSLMSEEDAYEAKTHLDYYKERGMKLTERKLRSLVADNKIDKMLINLGMTAEDLANEIGATVLDIYNPDNWEDGTFILNGTVYDVEFNYNGSIFKKR